MEDNNTKQCDEEGCSNLAGRGRNGKRGPHCRKHQTPRTFVELYGALQATTEELAWAAGFLDGEGSTICDSGNLVLSAGQNNTTPLEKLQKILGGRIHGPYVYPSRPNMNPKYDWKLNTNDAVVTAICAMLPYLCEPKRQQAWLAAVQSEIYKDDRLSRSGGKSELS